MMFDIKIGMVNEKFYICRPHGDEKARLNGCVRYLHRDLTWNIICGSENFYKTMDEAMEHIRMYENIVLGNGNQFLSEQEMKI